MILLIEEKNQPDNLFQKQKRNHPNMKYTKYTVEVKPDNFLDTKI